MTERHFFAAANQLLIIVDTTEADSGKYTCEMSNTLGTERGNIRLAVMPNPNCDSGVQGGVGVGMVGSAGSDNDGWTTVGIVIIAVVCCVVGTSLVWVVIIYHTRRRNEDCSITNTGWFIIFSFPIYVCNYIPKNMAYYEMISAATVCSRVRLGIYRRPSWLVKPM